MIVFGFLVIFALDSSEVRRCSHIYVFDAFNCNAFRSFGKFKNAQDRAIKLIKITTYCVNSAAICQKHTSAAKSRKTASICVRQQPLTFLPAFFRLLYYNQLNEDHSVIGLPRTDLKAAC